MQSDGETLDLCILRFNMESSININDEEACLVCGMCTNLLSLICVQVFILLPPSILQL